MSDEKDSASQHETAEGSPIVELEGGMPPVVQVFLGIVLVLIVASIVLD